MIILIFQVQHKPVCQVNLTRDIFLHLKEMAEVVCRVVASPAPSHYWWTFNNTFQLGRHQDKKYRMSKKNCVSSHDLLNECKIFVG